MQVYVRWLPSHTDAATLEKMKNLTLYFGYGPRSCPAERQVHLINIVDVLLTNFKLHCRLAFVQVKSMLAAIVRNFSFSLDCDFHKIVRVMGIAANPSQLPLLFVRRSF